MGKTKILVVDDRSYHHLQFRSSIKEGGHCGRPVSGGMELVGSVNFESHLKLYL